MSVVSPSPQSIANWKDRAIAGSEVITDAWEVTKIYCGRLAEWILYICMIINVISIFLVFAPVFSNIILSVQVVTLDIAGFGLQSMADHAKDHGNDKAASNAKTTSWFLIGLMVLTMLLVTIGVLFPPAKQSTDLADKVLILVRVVMTVIYGHVVHSLRHENQQLNMPDLLAKAAEFEGLKQRHEQLVKELKDSQQLAKDELRAKANELQDLEEERAKELRAKELKIDELKAKLDGLRATEERAKNELKAQVAEADKQRQEADLALQELKAKELRAKQKITRKLSPDELKSYGLRATEERAKPTTSLATKKAKPTQGKGLKPKAKELKKVEPIATNVATSRDKIKTAMQYLSSQGKELKYQDIADVAGVGYSTVKLHYKAMKEIVLAEKGA